MVLSIVQILYVVFITVAVGVVELLVFPFDRKGNVFHWLSRIHSASILKVCNIRLVVKGLENIDPSQTYIIVSNHASMFDIPSVVHGYPGRIHIVYKKELHKVPFFGWGLKLAKVYISIDRGRGTEATRSLEAAIDKIRNGATVLLFAEGTRSNDGKLQPFKRGAFNIAVRAGVPVVPLAINGSYKILQKGSIRFNPGTVTLVFDKPIVPPKEDGREAEIALRDRVHEVIASHYVDQ